MRANITEYDNELLRKTRKLKGFTQDYVARKVPISYSGYYKIERGYYKKISVDTYNKILEILEIKDVK